MDPLGLFVSQYAASSFPNESMVISEPLKRIGKRCWTLPRLEKEAKHRFIGLYNASTTKKCVLDIPAENEITIEPNQYVLMDVEPIHIRFTQFAWIYALYV